MVINVSMFPPPVTQLVGREPVRFGRAQYNVNLPEDTTPGPIIFLEAITDYEGV